MTAPAEGAQLGTLHDYLHGSDDDWQAGSVLLTEWNRLPWYEGQAIGVSGEVRVIAAQLPDGLKLSGGGHANWLALVRGPTGTVYVVPGCRVSAITYGAHDSCRDFVDVP